MGLGDVKKIGGRAQPRVFDRLGDVEHRVAFGDRHDVKVDITARNAAIDLGKCRFLLKKIFAGFERRLGTRDMPKPEGKFAADDAGLFELRRDAPRRVAGTKHDKCLAGWRRERHIDLPGGEAGGSQNGNQEQCDQGAQDLSVEGFLECHKAEIRIR